MQHPLNVTLEGLAKSFRTDPCMVTGIAIDVKSAGAFLFLIRVSSPPLDPLMTAQESIKTETRLSQGRSSF